MKFFYKFIYFKLLNWKVIGQFPAEVNKYIIIAAPHTHWYDLPMGLLLKDVTNTKINYVAKKELFKFPLKWFLNKSGGYALDRTPGQNKVEAYAALFDKYDEFRLNIAPEGTRKKVDEWKTGFYYIAKSANVPVVMVAFDYGNKQHKISKPYYLTDNMETDIQYMRSFFDGIIGKIPEYS